VIVLEFPPKLVFQKLSMISWQLWADAVAGAAAAAMVPFRAGVNSDRFRCEPE